MYVVVVVDVESVVESVLLFDECFDEESEVVDQFVCVSTIISKFISGFT